MCLQMFCVYWARIVSANCSAGTYRNASSNTCEDCPRGTYEGDKWQETCSGTCLDPKTTVGGAVSVDECLCKRFQYIIYHSTPLGTRRFCDVESTSLPLIQRRKNVVCPVGLHHWILCMFQFAASLCLYMY